MKKQWIDTSSVQDKLGDFFIKNKSTITEFGNTVNQTFEAFVFASLVNWYATNGWSVEIKNPGPGGFVKLKFNTRGRPSLYTYALCTKDNEKVQIRHGLRVATYHHRSEFHRPANIVLDVAVRPFQDSKPSELGVIS